MHDARRPARDVPTAATLQVTTPGRITRHGSDPDSHPLVTALACLAAPRGTARLVTALRELEPPGRAGLTCAPDHGAIVDRCTTRASISTSAWTAPSLTALYTAPHHRTRAAGGRRADHVFEPRDQGAAGLAATRATCSSGARTRGPCRADRGRHRRRRRHRARLRANPASKRFSRRTLPPTLTNIVPVALAVGRTLGAAVVCRYDALASTQLIRRAIDVHHRRLLRAQRIDALDLIMSTSKAARCKRARRTRHALERSPRPSCSNEPQYVDWSQGLRRTTIGASSTPRYELYGIRDYQSHVAMPGHRWSCAGRYAFLEGPQHGFNMLACAIRKS